MLEFRCGSYNAVSPRAFPLFLCLMFIFLFAQISSRFPFRLLFVRQTMGMVRKIHTHTLFGENPPQERNVQKCVSRRKNKSLRNNGSKFTYFISCSFNIFPPHSHIYFFYFQSYDKQMV